MSPRRVVLQVQGESFSSRYLLASHAITAAAAGDEVSIVLWFDPLKRWVSGGFDDANPGEDRQVLERHRALGLPPPSEMLSEARSLGARILACETGVRLAGLDPDAIRSRVDELPGLQEILELSRSASLALSF